MHLLAALPLKMLGFAADRDLSCSSKKETERRGKLPRHLQPVDLYNRFSLRGKAGLGIKFVPPEGAR